MKTASIAIIVLAGCSQAPSEAPRDQRFGLECSGTIDDAITGTSSQQFTWIVDEAKREIKVVGVERNKSLCADDPSGCAINISPRIIRAKFRTVVRSSSTVRMEKDAVIELDRMHGRATYLASFLIYDHGKQVDGGINNGAFTCERHSLAEVLTPKV